MATFSSMAALKRAIQQEAKAAMKEAQTKMLKKTKEETQGYYSQGNPTIYERTGAFSPDYCIARIWGFSFFRSLFR
mgnify:CR=1 FL=1